LFGKPISHSSRHFVGGFLGVEMLILLCAIQNYPQQARALLPDVDHLDRRRAALSLYLCPRKEIVDILLFFLSLSAISSTRPSSLRITHHHIITSQSHT
jgi:hypothetical protein